MMRELMSLANYLSSKLNNEISALYMYRMKSQGIVEEMDKHWDIAAKPPMMNRFVDLQNKAKSGEYDLLRLSDLLKQVSLIAEQLAQEEKAKQREQLK